MIDRFNLGTYTSDNGDLLKASTLSVSELVELESLRQMEFEQAVNMRTTTVLDLHRTFNKNERVVPFQINEAAHAPYQVQGFFEKMMSLEKFRDGIQISDETKIRMDQENQLINSIKNVAESFANSRDNNILRAFIKGAGVQVDASAKWDTGNLDISGDFGNLLHEIFKKPETNVRESEISSITIYYPLMLLPYLKDYAHLTDATGKLQINMSDFEYTGKTYGIRWIGSSKLNFVGKAVGVIKSNRTADHYTYVGDTVPSIEDERDKKLGLNTMWMTKYMGTLVYPQSFEQQNTNDRIMLINKVCDPVTVTL